MTTPGTPSTGTPTRGSREIWIERYRNNKSSFWLGALALVLLFLWLWSAFSNSDSQLRRDRDALKIKLGEVEKDRDRIQGELNERMAWLGQIGDALKGAGDNYQYKEPKDIAPTATRAINDLVALRDGQNNQAPDGAGMTDAGTTAGMGSSRGAGKYCFPYVSVPASERTGGYPLDVVIFPTEGVERSIVAGCELPSGYKIDLKGDGTLVDAARSEFERRGIKGVTDYAAIRCVAQK